MKERWVNIISIILAILVVVYFVTMISLFVIGRFTAAGIMAMLMLMAFYMIVFRHGVD